MMDVQREHGIGELKSRDYYRYTAAIFGAMCGLSGHGGKYVPTHWRAKEKPPSKIEQIEILNNNLLTHHHLPRSTFARIFGSGWHPQQQQQQHLGDTEQVNSTAEQPENKFARGCVEGSAEREAEGNGE